MDWTSYTTRISTCCKCTFSLFFLSICRYCNAPFVRFSMFMICSPSSLSIVPMTMNIINIVYVQILLFFLSMSRSNEDWDNIIVKNSQLLRMNNSLCVYIYRDPDQIKQFFTEIYQDEEELTKKTLEHAFHITF